jgi:hypothetical protein
MAELPPLSSGDSDEAGRAAVWSDGSDEPRPGEGYGQVRDGGEGRKVHR